MDILRRNTDYAMRMAVGLASRHNDIPVSAKELAEEGRFSYQLACKILQKLGKAKLVKSVMGPKGGFILSKEPSEISLLELIKIFQDGIRLNRCLLGNNQCCFQPSCQISRKLGCLQQHIDSYLEGITLKQLVDSQSLGQTKKTVKRTKRAYSCPEQ